MAIIRTNITDDNGTGTTGTPIDAAWKTEFYNQIDGEIGTVVTALGSAAVAFTPVDASGASLTFAFAAGKYVVMPNSLVYITLQVIYPATASGAVMKIGGFPHTVVGNAGLSFGLASFANSTPQATDATTTITCVTNGGVSVTNANVSGLNMIISGCYLR